MNSEVRVGDFDLKNESDKFELAKSTNDKVGWVRARIIPEKISLVSLI